MPRVGFKWLVMVSLVAIGASGMALLAAEEGGGGKPTPSGPPKGYECGDKALTGSGPGFKSSQEESEEAAIKDWLDKAKAVFTEAEWDKAKDSSIACVKQGLYSKCFASGVPCRPKVP
jgi:hypothetical protein